MTKIVVFHIRLLQEAKQGIPQDSREAQQGGLCVVSVLAFPESRSWRSWSPFILWSLHLVLDSRHLHPISGGASPLVTCRQGRVTAGRKEVAGMEVVSAFPPTGPGTSTTRISSFQSGSSSSPGAARPARQERCRNTHATRQPSEFCHLSNREQEGPAWAELPCGRRSIPASVCLSICLSVSLPFFFISAALASHLQVRRSACKLLCHHLPRFICSRPAPAPVPGNFPLHPSRLVPTLPTLPTGYGLPRCPRCIPAAASSCGPPPFLPSSPFFPRAGLYLFTRPRCCRHRHQLSLWPARQPTRSSPSAGIPPRPALTRHPRP